MKEYDLSVRTGVYKDRDGNEKNRYLKIGVVMSNENGPFMLLDKTFNPAGVNGNEGKGSIMVSMFKPRVPDDRNDPASPQFKDDKSPGGLFKQAVANKFEDDIPF